MGLVCIDSEDSVLDFDVNRSPCARNAQEPWQISDCRQLVLPRRLPGHYLTSERKSAKPDFCLPHSQHTWKKSTHHTVRTESPSRRTLQLPCYDGLRVQIHMVLRTVKQNTASKLVLILLTCPIDVDHPPIREESEPITLS